MKLAPFLVVLSLGSILAACNSLDNPVAGLLNTGNDGRVYNSSTGSYEWPSDADQQRRKQEEEQQLKRKGQTASTPNGTPTGTPASTPRKSKATPQPSPAQATPKPEAN